MEEEQAVIIRRPSPLGALFLGIFGTLIALIVSAAVIVVYGMRIVDHHVRDVVSLTPELAARVTEWQDALPPALADAINDRRALDYRESVDLDVELVSTELGRRQSAVVELTNLGDRAISLLALRVSVSDEDGLPIDEFTTYAATPLTLEDDWRGPLLPGSKRRFVARNLRHDDFGVTASVEVTELRVFNGDGDGDGDGRPAADVSSGSIPLPDVPQLSERQTVLLPARDEAPGAITVAETVEEAVPQAALPSEPQATDVATAEPEQSGGEPHSGTVEEDQGSAEASESSEAEAVDEQDDAGL